MQSAGQHTHWVTQEDRVTVPIFQMKSGSSVPREVKFLLEGSQLLRDQAEGLLPRWTVTQHSVFSCWGFERIRLRGGGTRGGTCRGLSVTHWHLAATNVPRTCPALPAETARPLRRQSVSRLKMPHVNRVTSCRVHT